MKNLKKHSVLCVCGEMDITTVYGTVILGSSPGRRTKLFKGSSDIMLEFFLTQMHHKKQKYYKIINR